LALPGWIVAVRYEPLQPAKSKQEISTTKVLYEQLSDVWEADGLVQGANKFNMELPVGANLKLSVNEKLSQGTAIFSLASDSKFSVSCESKSIDISPGGTGGDFLTCLQNMLIEKGYEISKNEIYQNVLGSQTKKALGSFFESFNLVSPATDQNWAEQILDAEFRLLEAQASFDSAEKLSSDSIGYIKASNNLVRASNVLKRMREQGGFVISAKNWETYEPGHEIHFLATTKDGDSEILEFGSETKFVVVDLPATILEAANRQWLIEGADHGFVESEISSPAENPNTGILEIQVKLATSNDIELNIDSAIAVKLVANSTKGKVLSVPGGALKGTFEDGHLLVESSVAGWKTIPLKNTQLISGRIILDPKSGLKEGDKVRLV